MHCKKCIMHSINFRFSITHVQYKQITFLKVSLESFCLRNAHQYRSISALIIHQLTLFCFSQRLTSGIPLDSLGIKACNQACNVQFWKHLCISLFFFRMKTSKTSLQTLTSSRWKYVYSILSSLRRDSKRISTEKLNWSHRGLAL